MDGFFYYFFFLLFPAISIEDIFLLLINLELVLGLFGDVGVLRGKHIHSASQGHGLGNIMAEDKHVSD